MKKVARMRAIAEGYDRMGNQIDDQRAKRRADAVYGKRLMRMAEPVYGPQPYVDWGLPQDMSM